VLEMSTVPAEIHMLENSIIPVVWSCDIHHICWNFASVLVTVQTVFRKSHTDGVSGASWLWLCSQCLLLTVFTKGGHSQFKSATPQYCGQPNRLQSCGLKKVAELRLRTFTIWLPQFRNFPQSPANSATF
jgi:hypothetical protein